LARAARPIRSTIIVDRGKQTRTVFYNLEGVVPAQADHPDPSVIRSCRVLYVDQFGIEGMLRAARIAREAGIAVVGDLEDDSWPGFAELLDIIDHLILSHDFAERITGHADPARAARSLWNERRSIVVVTCGAAGCWYVKSDGDPAFQPAFPVVAADSTGCGDVFRGAYAVALSEWQALTDRVEFAAAAAALRAQLAEFPERAQVVSLLQCRP
jgi:sugar/nucleoside kinase (ribokinase family)